MEVIANFKLVRSTRMYIVYTNNIISKDIQCNVGIKT